MDQEFKSNELLAKSPLDHSCIRAEETVFGHTKKVLESYTTLFGSTERPGRLTSSWLRFFKLNGKNDMAMFLATTAIASILHDIGKLNSGFQKAVRGERDAQVIRHEHLSCLMLCFDEVKKWIESIDHVEPMVAISAVAGHHLKAHRRDMFQPLSVDRNSARLYPEEINRIFGIIQDHFLTNQLLTEIPEWFSFQRKIGVVDWDILCSEVTDDFIHFHRRIRRDGRLRQLMNAVRSALIVADSAGSALVREGADVTAWLSETFDDKLLLDDKVVHENIIAPRIAQIERNGGVFRWNGFQDAAENLPDRALLLAPCGSGKTLAAWRWIKARVTNRGYSRVIFLYPTRATATEGFRDYVSWAPEADAALMHGTASYELEGMFANPDDQRINKDFLTDERLFALGFWPRRLFSATVEQFLAFIQHSYKSTCLLPLLTESVVVIDEVHSFDRGLFSALKMFLKNFELPVLCMTASLPARRIEDLKENGLTVFPEDPGKFMDLKASSEMPRYKVKCVANEAAALKMAEQAVKNREKVLWVVNTINRCQRIAKKLGAICYHSRFKLEDRGRRHNEMISAFQGGGGPIVAVTTQVCEMSLDLDADTLISEYAPITSLIQRMGRCNRHARPGSGKTGHVYLYAPDDGKPYSKEDLCGLDDFLREIDLQIVSQSFLQELLERFGPAEVELDKYSAFLESGPWATNREVSLRDTDDFLVPSILDTDIEKFLEMRGRRARTEGFGLPAPRKQAHPDPRLGAYPWVAPSANYCSRYGLMRAPKEELFND